MNKVVKDVIKNGLVLAVVGCLLALAAPTIANGLVSAGLLDAASNTFAHAAGTHVPWTAAFFGSFGALHAAVTPILTAAFGGEKNEVAVSAPAKEQCVALAISQQVEKEPECGMCASTHRNQLATSRTAAAMAGRGV